MHKKIQWLIAKLTDGTPQKMLTQLHWIYQYGRRYWKAMILYTVLGVAGTGISLVSSFISKDLVDIITGHQTGELLPHLCSHDWFFYGECHRRPGYLLRIHLH